MLYKIYITGALSILLNSALTRVWALNFVLTHWLMDKVCACPELVEKWAWKEFYPTGKRSFPIGADRSLSAFGGTCPMFIGPFYHFSDLLWAPVWAWKESNLRPLSYQDSVLPLNYTPRVSQKNITHPQILSYHLLLFF